MKIEVHMRRAGYSLLELTFAMAILAIVSALSFVVLQGSTEASALTQAKGEVQANLRDVITAITSEVRAAYTDRTIKNMDPQFVPEDVVPISVSDGGRTLTFTLPVAVPGSTALEASTPITYRYITEDGVNENPINGRLEPGEDEDGDGVLARRIVREQDGATRVVGSVNDLSDVQFTLLPNAADNTLFTTLQIRVESSKGYGLDHEQLVRAESQTTIALQN